MYNACVCKGRARGIAQGAGISAIDIRIPKDDPLCENEAVMVGAIRSTHRDTVWIRCCPNVHDLTYPDEAITAGAGIRLGVVNAAPKRRKLKVQPLAKSLRQLLQRISGEVAAVNINIVEIPHHLVRLEVLDNTDSNDECT